MSNNPPLAIVILAAGKGTRMKSDAPKVMHELAGRPMINWLIDTCAALSPQKIITVIGPDMLELAAAVAPHETVIQQTRDGTGGALKCAMPALKGFTGNVLVLLGDTPLLSEETLKSLIAAKVGAPAAILGCTMQNSHGYGRLVLDDAGQLLEIVEEKDANEAQKTIKLINTGAFCLDGKSLAGWLAKIDSDNAQNEFYITQIPAIIKAEGGNTAVAITQSPEEIRGCNTRVDLAALEKTLQTRLRENAMNAGVQMIDPDTVYLWNDTQIASGVLVEPNVFFGPKVTIEENVHIKAFTHVEGAHIKKSATIGPFARIRPNTEIGEDVRVGNFVEIKKSTIKARSKIGHLAYVGDTQMDEDVNFSAGAITVNYDGFDKHETHIGKNVMVGSNVNLVAPITLGDGAFIAAGSTITENIPEDALSIAREDNDIRQGWAAKYRQIKIAAKKRKAS